MNSIKACFAFCLLTFGATGCSIIKRDAKTFESPAIAVNALSSSLEREDKNELKKIFGAEGEYLLSSGDAVQDKTARARFLRMYKQKNRLEAKGNDEVVLRVGDSDWPFPIPLVREGDGWVFDSAAGKEEILNRRIGANELATIKVMKAFIEAEEQYYDLNVDGDSVPKFAGKILSTPGKTDGLYWESKPGLPPSPFGPMIAAAEEEGYSKENAKVSPFHGYFYKILTGQGENTSEGPLDYMDSAGRMTEGFALLAYPADYGDSGIMTFQVNHEGRIFQKDLGKKTEQAAKEIDTYDPDPSWQPVE